MKALAITLLSLGMLAGFTTAPASAKVHYPQKNLAAEDTDTETSEEDTEAAKPTKVGEGLKKCSYHTDARPRPAEVYFVFRARRDDGESGILSINKTYKKMLHDKTVEVVMICEDMDSSDIKEWVAKEKVHFPIIPYNKVAQDLPFPYKRSSTGNTDLLPILVVMDAEGKKIDQASGSAAIAMFGKWKKIMRHYKAKKARANRI